MDRYNDILSDISYIITDATNLNIMLTILGNNATLKNAKEVVSFSDNILLQINTVSCKLISSYKAHWIDEDQYNLLINELEKAKSILSMLGLEA